MIYELSHKNILIGFYFIVYVLFMLTSHICLIPFLHLIWSFVYFLLLPFQFVLAAFS